MCVPVTDAAERRSPPCPAGKKAQISKLAVPANGSALGGGGGGGVCGGSPAARQPPDLSGTPIDEAQHHRAPEDLSAERAGAEGPARWDEVLIACGC